MFHVILYNASLQKIDLRNSRYDRAANKPGRRAGRRQLWMRAVGAHSKKKAGTLKSSGLKERCNKDQGMTIKEKINAKMAQVSMIPRTIR